MNSWINGRPGSRIDCSDRGLQYGDGLFETMRVRRRRVRLLDYHLERLLEGCRRLEMHAPGAAVLRRELRKRATLIAEGVLKLIVTRGAGPRGYRPSGRERCNRVLTLHALGSARSVPAPVRVRLCSTRLGSNPALAGLKSLNRLESVIARQEWRDQRVWEGLMCDAQSNVVCGTMSNLFMRRGSTLMTPMLDQCGIAGVMRRWVLEQAPGLRLRCWQGRVSVASIRDAEEVFMTNAVAGIVSVSRIDSGGPMMRFRQTETADRLRARLQEL